ncbi:MAG: TonB family protein [Bacteroidota bacterium]
MPDNRFNKDDGRALTVTLTLGVALLAFSLWYTIDMNRNNRPSFIEVEFGEFQTGSLAEFSEEKNEEVAKRPTPSEAEPEEVKEETPVPEEKPQETAEEETKPVDLPDQVEDVQEDPVQTPETTKIDPNQKQAEVQPEEVVVPPEAKKDEEVQEGAPESGDERGAKGDVDADQDAGNDEEKSAPYELKWEGDIERAPMVQPLPTNNSNSEAVISVRFEVRPNGTVGRIIPLRKMNPELEREVMRTLRTWRFSRLPGGVPQQSQWGTITFRFVFD